LIEDRNRCNITRALMGNYEKSLLRRAGSAEWGGGVGGTLVP
jgi:hypothetical protein